MGFFDTLANQVKNQVIDGLTKQVENRIDKVITENNPLRKIDINLGTGEIADSHFKIDEFRSNLSKHNEVAKADKFQVVMRIPYAGYVGKLAESGARVKGPIGWANERELTLQCEVAELPGRDINLIEYRHYGFIRRIPHMNQYGQASFTFYCTGDMHEKKMFDSWMDMMVPTLSGLVEYPVGDDLNTLYETDIDINQYDTMGNLMYQAKLFDAIPTSVSPLSLDWNNDSVHRMTVVFAFRKWTSPATEAKKYAALEVEEVHDPDQMPNPSAEIPQTEAIQADDTSTPQ